MAGKIRFENTETAQLYGNEVYVYKHKGYAAGICHGVKDGDEKCKNEMADFLSKQIAWNCVLIPVPQHTGKAEYTLDIANKIKERIGNIYNIQISDILECDERPTLYEQKQKIIEKTSSSFTEEEISNLNTGNIRIKQGCEIPKQNQNVYILDNVISTGKTYEEIKKLIPGSYPLIFAASKKYIENINLKMDNISDYINNHYEEDKQIKQFSDSLTTSEQLKLKQLWMYEDDNFTVNRNTLSFDGKKINIGNYLKLILRNNIDRIENPLDYDNKDVLNDHCKYIQSLRNKWAQTVDYPLKKEDEIKASQYYFESNYIYSQDKNLWERIEDEATIKYPNDFESVNKLLNDYKEKYNNCKKIVKNTLSNYVDKENGPYELLKYLRVEKELNSDDIKSQIISTYINTSDNEINEKILLKNTLSFFENENDYSEIMDNFDFMLMDKKDKEMELENWKKEQEYNEKAFIYESGKLIKFNDYEDKNNFQYCEIGNNNYDIEKIGTNFNIYLEKNKLCTCSDIKSVKTFLIKENEEFFQTELSKLYTDYSEDPKLYSEHSENKEQLPEILFNKLSSRTDVWFKNQNKTVKDMLDYIIKIQGADFTVKEYADNSLYIQGYDNGLKPRGKMNLSEADITYLYKNKESFSNKWIEKIENHIENQYQYYKKNFYDANNPEELLRDAKKFWNEGQRRAMEEIIKNSNKKIEIKPVTLENKQQNYGLKSDTKNFLMNVSHQKSDMFPAFDIIEFSKYASKEQDEKVRSFSRKADFNYINDLLNLQKLIYTKDFKEHLLNIRKERNITQVEINNKTFKDSCNNMIMNNPVNSIKEIECSITENLSDKEIESVVKQTNDFIKNKSEENISTKNNQNNNGSRKGGRK